MKIEEQVCTLEQAKKLKELGVTYTDANYCYLENSGGGIEFGDVGFMFQHHCDDYQISVHPQGFDESFKEQSWPAFTVAELGVMLPHRYQSQRLDENTINLHKFTHWCIDTDFNSECEVCSECATNIVHEAKGNSEAEARAAMLIYLLENNLITPEEVNNRLTHQP